MENTQNLQSALTDAIRNQIGPIRNDPLPSARKAAFATRRGKSSEVINVGENSLDKF